MADEVKLHAEQKVEKEAFFAFQQKIVRETAALADFVKFKGQTASEFDKTRTRFEALELLVARRNEL